MNGCLFWLLSSNFFLTCHKEIGYFLILCVALSHCGKDTESLQHTDFLFVALSHCSKPNYFILPKNAKTCIKNIQIMHKKCQKVPTIQKKRYLLPFLVSFWQHIPILFATNILSYFNFTTPIKLLWGTLFYVLY